jgi:hypothetical protein
MTAIHDPPNDRTLDEIYVFVSEDEDGRRGILASIMPTFAVAGPLVTGSPGVVELFKHHATEIAKLTGKRRIICYKYTRGEELWRA